MNASICEAISNREALSFYYDGGSRTAEPHCHGVSRDGNELLRAYQTGGYSSSGNPVGWKLFRVDGMSSVASTGDVFPSNRPQYNPDDSHMSTICCCV